MSVITQTKAVQENIYEVERMYVKLRTMQQNMQVVMLNTQPPTGKAARPHVMINGEDAEALLKDISKLLFNSAQLLKTINTPLTTIKKQVRREVIEELVSAHRMRGNLLNDLKES